MADLGHTLDLFADLDPVPAPPVPAQPVCGCLRARRDDDGFSLVDGQWVHAACGRPTAGWLAAQEVPRG